MLGFRHSDVCIIYLNNVDLVEKYKLSFLRLILDNLRLAGIESINHVTYSNVVYRNFIRINLYLYCIVSVSLA